MTDLSNLLSGLSPEQRELLQLRLKKQQAKNEAAQGRPSRIPRRPAGLSELPLSFSQQRLWFLDQWNPGNPAYNMYGAFGLRGALDVAALAGAFNALVNRHEALRTSFPAKDGRPRQEIAPPARVPIPQVDLSALEGGRAREEGRRLSIELGFQRFDLSRGPVLRLALVRLAADEHWMVTCFHHIVSDGWSVGVFNRELFALYAAIRRGVPAPLPSLPIQYADFAVWQRDWLQGEVLEAQLGFWKEYLTGAPSRLELTYDRPRGEHPVESSGSVDLRLRDELAERLRTLALGEGATLFMVLVAGYAVLLSRYAGAEDVVLGSPIANRNRSEIEGLIGFFVNTLAFRVDLKGNPTCRELLARTRKMVSGAYDHQDLPFELLIDQLDLERDPSYPPLVQVALSLQKLAPLGVPFGDLRVERIPLRTAAAKYDLLAAFTENPDGEGGVIEYDPALFDRDTVVRMVGHLLILLDGFARRPDAPISELPMLSAGEVRQLTVDWNQTASAFPRDKTVAELFEEQARATPQATAVVFRGQSLTYAALDREADRLARRLRRLGVGPEVPVGLCADRSLDLIVGLLAIVKAGGAFVPLDPAYPAERLGYMLESSAAPLVLAQAGTLGSLPATAARVLLLEELRAEAPDGGEADAPALAPQPENLLYIMYTSGSTGRPKGVAISHRSAIRLVREAGYARFGPDETFLQLVPLSFDPSMFEIWGALLHGGRLVLFPKRVPLPEDLEETIREQGVTTLWLTTGLFHQAVDHKIEILRPLRQLLAGGEALSLPHVRRVVETFPDLRLVNGYGPTEVTCFTTCWQAHPLPQDATSVPIGKPIANTRVLVLDPRQGNLMPVGVPGELCAGGEGLARCYFGRPDLTAERFVPDPCPPSGEPGARLYRTGDRVRSRPDGTIEFMGRFDNQVKVRGFRIELGEIEAAVARHPGVLETLVLVREDTPGHRRIVAYVVPREGAPLDSAALKTFVGDALPDYMVPAAWVLLEAFPLTPNGKVDRRALPTPELEREAGHEWIAPRNETEARIAEIWGEVLGVEKVGAEDDFFKLGGHSLLATQLMSRIRDTFEIEMSFARFFKTPTVAGVAAAIVEQRAAEVDESDLLAMLADLKSLSPEELEAQLAGEGETV